MKLSTFIIKEDKKHGINRLFIYTKSGSPLGNVTPRNGCQTVEFRISGTEILARRHSYSTTYYDIIKEGQVIGRFFKSGTYRSDVELFRNGSAFSFSIFSSHDFKSSKIVSGQKEIGFLSKKKHYFAVEYGLAINASENIQLILTSMLLHVQYQKNVVMNDHNIFI